MVEALRTELLMRREEAGDAVVETIYFGGGTPSLLSSSQLRSLIAAVYENFRVVPHPEITLEANPDDLNDSALQDLRDGGVNRLSIGVQSFHDADLKLMNRAHNTREAEACLEMAGTYFDNLSIDLIYGIPGQSMQGWEENLQKALGFNIPHISSYALTVEPRTALKRFIEKGLIPQVDDEMAAAQFQRMTEILGQKGFVHYELSNFGKPGYFSQNNTAYWQGKSYLGIGPSAHSYDGKTRRWNLRNNPRYLKAIQAGELPYEEEVLSRRDRYNEYVMTGLRTIWGVSLERVKADFGLKYYEYLLQQSARFLEQGLVYLEEETLLVSKKGKFLTDGIASDLFLINLK